LQESSGGFQPLRLAEILGQDRRLEAAATIDSQTLSVGMAFAQRIVEDEIPGVERADRIVQPPYRPSTRLPIHMIHKALRLD
jgi:hypothetical protein